jgi:hypothetical protein
MGASERNKGARGEQEIIQLLRTYGWPNAERTSNGRAQIARGDFANGPRIHLDAKRTEVAHVWAWWEQANRDCRGRDPLTLNSAPALPVVAFRRSRSPWLALIEFEELLPLLALKEFGL